MGDRGRSAASFRVALTAVGVLVTMLIGDSQTEAALMDEAWFVLLLALVGIIALVALVVAAAPIISKYGRPLPSVPTVRDRRESKRARAAAARARQRYLGELRYVLRKREARASADLEAGGFSTGLLDFELWVRRNRKGIHRHVERGTLHGAWDRLLECATANNEALQAAWSTVDQTTSHTAPFDDAGRKVLSELLAAIISARRAVDSLLSPSG